jgi:hypothetical protein
MLKRARGMGILLLAALPAFPCVCVNGNLNARAGMHEVSLVFRGTVTNKKAFPAPPWNKWRERFEVIFQVQEYWKGSPGTTVNLYVQSGSDCGPSTDYEVGASYLVYANETEARDLRVDGHYLFGWNDILPEGTKILEPASCSPGGEVSTRRTALIQLGRGRLPPKK